VIGRNTICCLLALSVLLLASCAGVPATKGSPTKYKSKDLAERWRAQIPNYRPNGGGIPPTYTPPIYVLPQGAIPVPDNDLGYYGGSYPKYDPQADNQYMQIPVVPNYYPQDNDEDYYFPLYFDE